MTFISLFELYVLFTGLLANVFIFIFIFLFIRRVKGPLRRKGWLLMIGSIAFFFGQFMDHPPGMFIYPDLFIILSPLVFIVSFSFIYYAIKGITKNITSYYNQAHICLVHRGKILEGEPIYSCPNCTTIYCQICYEQVIKQDGCWSCGVHGKVVPKVKPKEQLETEEIIMKKIKKKAI